MQETKKPMSIGLQAVLIYISSVILGLITSGLFGKLFRYIEGPYRSSNLGVMFSEEADTFLGGFIWGYLFFLGLLVGLFVKKKFWPVWVVGFVLLGWISLWDGKYFLYSVVFSLLGFLLGKLILFIKNKSKK